jgi:glycosyltransferase involved in cell wall biosynthesis
VLLLDDSLTGWAGHNAGYDFSIQDELAKREIESVIYANVKAKELLASRPVGLQLVFHHYADLTHREYAHFRLPYGVAGAFYLSIGNWNHFIDLLRSTPDELQSGDVILTTMYSSVTSFAVATWLLLQRMRGKHLTYLFVVHNYPTRFFRTEWITLRNLGRGHKILISAHTQDIASQCQKITGQSVVILPLPFAGRGAESATRDHSSDPHEQQVGPLTITYLGMATFQKGYDLVVSALEQLNELFSEQRVSFVVQFNCFLYDDQNIGWKQRLLEGFGSFPGFALVDGALNETAYVEYLDNADILLVPNRSEFYAGALSGVFTEAVAMGKPVIVADGTFMATELRKGVGAGFVFRDNDAHDLAQTILQAIASYPDIRSRATAYAQTWRENHSPQRYVDILLRTIQ